MTPSERDADLIQVIHDDHRELERTIAEFDEQSSISPEHRRQLVDHVIAAVARHTVAEEQFLYPDLRERLHGGDQLADAHIAEHAEAEELMQELEATAPSDARFEQLLGQLAETMRSHFSQEENTVLPTMQALCTDEELHYLGNKMALAMQRAPTHPHPSAPDPPQADSVIDPGIGIIDKIRTALQKQDPYVAEDLTSGDDDSDRDE